MTRKEQLNRLFIEFNLNEEDTFKHNHYHIITRSGIDKIQDLSFRTCEIP